MQPKTLDRETLEYVCRHLRPASAAEAFATRWNDDPAALARDLWTGRGPGAYSVSIERPVYAGGYINTHPGVWRLWGFATPEWPRIAVGLTKWVKRFMLPAIFKTGAHRVESFVLDGQPDVEGWLRLLGGRKEAVLSGFGRKGENVISYVWGR